MNKVAGIIALKKCQKKSEILQAFVREIAYSYDHDNLCEMDGDKGWCRTCDAKKVLEDIGVRVHEE